MKEAIATLENTSTPMRLNAVLLPEIWLITAAKLD
jgi:hypothetical protein